MGDDNFAPVLSKSARKNRKNKYFRPEKTIEDYVAIFERKHEVLQNSKFTTHLKKVLYKLIPQHDRSNITHIRCLAIGQPTEADAVIYQASILALLQDWFSVKGSHVSVWDPIINDKDREFFVKVMGITISEDDFKDIDPTKILWYAPHAPISVMESLLRDKKTSPKYFLANFIPDYETRLLTKDLNSKYPGLKEAIELSTQLSLSSLEEWNEADNLVSQGCVVISPSEELTKVEKAMAEIKIDDRVDIENVSSESLTLGKTMVSYEINKFSENKDRDACGNLGALDGKWNCIKLDEKLSDDEVWRLAVNDLGVHVWVS
ncbi:hypothetical protein NADFUDRAFT_44010 [Nadsonia fulvescens var. elongata DSM 6958]|uniref:SRR1-like domain-containing protein n=1 Tax=Nadsonia fulvescens var. elongata DSM 6958 TaxID=857566 RepID=A0A1E3PEA8_9ASCO|nr:hypothetical protein NADFUDRAFT_44010 [Nadsonia fulvescens var. elongata DSM 6958]